MHADVASCAELEAKVRRLTNMPRLSLSSMVELCYALFDPAGPMRFAPPVGAALPPGRRKRKQTHSLRGEVLLDLRRAEPRAAELVDAILEHRQLSHKIAMCETYIGALPPGARCVHRVHGKIFQARTMLMMLTCRVRCC